MSLSEPIPALSNQTTALIRCRDYSAQSVKIALRRAFDAIGSPERFIRPGDRVLLKPNMLSAKEPERAVTTHPQIIEAMGEIVLDCRGKIVLGDSPAGAGRDLSYFWNKTGISAAAKRLGIEPTSFEDCGIKSIAAPGGFVCISRAALDVDSIINLPKLKTHLLTRMTGAVKNMFGCVPGYRKAGMHHQAPTPLSFSRLVISVYQQVIPALNVMDAVLAMEGNGPSSGSPRHLGAILVAEDALTVDSVAASLVTIDPKKLPIFQAAVERGLWSWDSDPIVVLGDKLDELRVTNFRVPDLSRLERIPGFVHKALQKVIWIKPRADQIACSSCSACVDNCPEQAMVMKNGIPKIDYKLCVKCGCCDEICPENAIQQEISLLARLIS
ncbi:MAG: DUF362 domain-containing protein [bacterium]|nr:DUF362 domain-containing protein [bacterium]